MAKKKLKEQLKKIEDEAVVKNDPRESAIDTIIKDQDKVAEDLYVKSLEVESDTKLEADKGVGQELTLRHFFFKPNPEQFKRQIPTTQELFNSHLKQIEIELWKDEWQPFYQVDPRLVFLNKKFQSVPSHDPKLEWYCFIIAALPAKGSNLSYTAKPQTLAEIANENRTSSAKI